MTRRILILNHFAAPRGAPGGTRHVEFTDRLEGWDATVVASDRNYFTRWPTDVLPTGAHSTAYRTVRTTGYAGNGLSRVVNWASFAVGAFVVGFRERRLDVVYASSPHLLAALSGWALARLRRARFVLEIRDLWPRVLIDMGQLRESSRLYRLLRALELFLYCHADAIVVLAEGVRRTLVEEERVPEAQVRCIPNGADPRDFEPPASRDELRRRLGVNGQLVVAYTGAHGPANGLELALDAAAALADELPHVRFVLVGDGVDKPRLVAAAADRGVKNVEFHDPIPKAEMPALLGAVDVGLHVLADVPLFRYGVSPNKLFDYMAAGLPVITNTGGEVADLVREADCGLACPPNGIAAAVRAMDTAGPDQRSAWGRNGREFIGRNRSREALAAELAALLDTECHGVRRSRVRRPRP